MNPSDATTMRPDLGPALARIHQKMAELAQAAGQAEADCPELRELEELAKVFALPAAPGSWVPKFAHIQWGTVASLMGGTGHLEPD